MLNSHFKNITTYTPSAVQAAGTTTIVVADDDTPVILSVFLKGGAAVQLNFAGDPVMILSGTTVWNGNCYFAGAKGEDITIVTGGADNYYAITVGLLEDTPQCISTRVVADKA